MNSKMKRCKATGRFGLVFGEAVVLEEVMVTWGPLSYRMAAGQMLVERRCPNLEPTIRTICSARTICEEQTIR